jgi:hypothetical protein
LVVVEPSPSTSWPATQSVHAVHDGALAVVEYSPTSQAAHWRFALVEPARETSWPAMQSVHAAHDGALVAVSNRNVRVPLPDWDLLDGLRASSG